MLIARGAAGAVHPATYELSDWEAWIERGQGAGRTVLGVGFAFPVPEVIVLMTYDGQPQQAVPYTRRNVYRRDGGRCQYCGGTPGLSHLTIDHVVPRSRGGDTTWTNCVTACTPCNARKADRTVQQARMRLLRDPRAPNWPGGLDPRALRDRPTWHRFLPRARLEALLRELPPEERAAIEELLP